MEHVDCVTCQITMRNPIWQVMLCSHVMGYAPSRVQLIKILIINFD